MSKLRAELLRFLLVGLATVLIDWAFYRLTMAAGLSVGPAKAIGFVVGSVFAFVTNRQWTFAIVGRGNTREVWRFVTLYGMTLVVNVGVNSGLLSLIERDQAALIAAFVIATSISAALNFCGMKLLVFRPTGP